MGKYVYDEARQIWGRPRMGQDPRGLQKAPPMMGAGFSTAGTGGPEARTREAQAKMAEDALFNQRQNQFKQTFGRDLTNGAASKRGSAGIPTQVSPDAMGNTYWENDPKRQNNDVELAGMMNRGAQRLAKGDMGGLDELLKGYNDGRWSSRKDAKDVRIENGMITLIGEDGEAINKTPIPLDELQNITGSSLTGQNVFQRSGGTSATGLPTSSAKGKGKPSSTAKEAAKFIGDKSAAAVAAEIKALSNPDASANFLLSPEEKAANATRLQDLLAQQQQIISDSGQRILGAGTATGADNYQNTQQRVNDRINTMMEQGASRNDIINDIWQMTGDRNLMTRVQGALTDAPEKKATTKKAQGIPTKPIKPVPKRKQPTPRKPVGMPTKETPTPKVPPKKAKAIPQTSAGYTSYMDKETLGGTIRSDMGFIPTQDQVNLSLKVKANPEKYSTELQNNAKTVLKRHNAEQYQKRRSSGRSRSNVNRGL